MSTKRKLSLAAAAALAASGFSSTASAVDIYSETWATDGAVPAPYTVTSTSAAGGATVTGGVLTLTNGPSPATSGYVRVTQDVTGTGSNYNLGAANANFNPALDQNGNANLLTWTLNLQSNRNAPSGFGTGNYGAAYVLGGSTENFIAGGEGYAVVLGSTGADPISLVRYTAGMQPIGTGAKSAPYSMITGAADANLRYQSIKVTYAPGTNEWRMYVRDDGTTAFTDPTAPEIPSDKLVGVAEQQASATALNYTGFLWNHAGGTGAGSFNQLARFDNIKLTNTAATVVTSRDLVFDADATDAATDGNGIWTTPNTWIDNADASHLTWTNNPDDPDNATFGAGGGNTGAFAVDVGIGTQYAASIKFAANSADYSLTGSGTIMLLGHDDDNNVGTTKEGIIADKSATISSVLNWAAASKADVSGAANTLTITNLQGGGRLQKNGAGTLLLPNPSPSRSGVTDIETGVVRVQLANGGSGVTGLGSGQTNVKSDATLWLDAGVGAFTVSGTAGELFMGESSKLRVTGLVTWQKNFPAWATGTATDPKTSEISVDANSTFYFRSQMRNSIGTADNIHTINVTGAGTVKVGNSGSNAGGDWTIFGGSWNVSNGKLVFAQNSEITNPTSSGDTLNAPGYKNGDSALGNRVTVSTGGTVVGTENVPNGTGATIRSYKADVVMNGGTLASGNGKDTTWGGPFTTNAGTTSTVAVYDPLNPTVARNLGLTHGVGNLFIQPGPTNWGGTLVVDPGTLATGGAFNISREAGAAVNVTPGATIEVKPGATLNLGFNGGDPNGYDTGAADALKDSTDGDLVNVVNNGTFTSSNGDKNVGGVGGTGSTTVVTGSTLAATHIRQTNLTVNGNTTIRQIAPNPGFAGGDPAGTSRATNLTLGPGARLDLKNNKLITANSLGTATPGPNDTRVYSGISGMIQSGFVNGQGDWSGPGIVTTTEAAQGGLTTLGSAIAGEVLPFESNTILWGGQTVSMTDTIVMYTHTGDANLDGLVDGGDYAFIDAYVGSSAGDAAYYKGDFNYDGFIDGGDYAYIDVTVGSQAFQTGAGEGNAAGSLSAVPEPASLSVIGLGAAALLARRRRRQV